MRLLIFILLLPTTLFAHPAVKRLQYGRDWCYQPILINGEEAYRSHNISGGSEVAAERYEVIKQILSQYDRPFTVLDIGANNGYFSLRIAEDFDAVCTLIDSSERLGDICALNTEHNRIIYLQKNFTTADIREFAKREHFDVILALLVLHHVDNWRPWVETLFTLGDNVIIETPSDDDPINTFEHTKQLAHYLATHPNAVEIGAFPRGDTFDHMFLFSQHSIREGKLGISADTFFRFNGSFPRPDYVQQIQIKYKEKKWLLQGVDYLVY